MRSIKNMLVAVAWLLVSGCAGQEEQVVEMFFSAIQGGDDDAVEMISLAKLPGGVESWEIVEVGPESQAVFGLPALHEELTKKRRELRLENEKNANFAGDNRSLFEEYKKKHEADPEEKFSGDLGEFQTAWDERMERQGRIQKEVDGLNAEAKALSSAAGLSLNMAVNENFAGDVKGKELQLRINDGSGEKNYTFRLKRYQLVDTQRNMSPIARWIITDIEEQA